MPDVDVRRIQRYLMTIRENTEDIRGLLSQYEDHALCNERYLLKALKYCLIEIAEVMADTLQHFLARKKGLAAESYLEVLEKAAQTAMLDPELLQRLRFFFKFRNMLVHRYWEIDDRRQETRKGLKDFELFTEAVTTELAAASSPPD
jgi:uncharacterized protein YutE (UPF0331/DUF86 family)